MAIVRVFISRREKFPASTVPPGSTRILSSIKSLGNPHLSLRTFSGAPELAETGGSALPETSIAHHPPLNLDSAAPDWQLTGASQAGPGAGHTSRVRTVGAALSGKAGLGQIAGHPGRSRQRNSRRTGRAPAPARWHPRRPRLAASNSDLEFPSARARRRESAYRIHRSPRPLRCP